MHSGVLWGSDERREDLSEAWKIGDSLVARRLMRAVQELLALPLVVPFFLLVRLARPLVLVRLKSLSARLGHLAGDTELYLCERDTGINVPERRCVDLFYHGYPVPNRQLARMWARHIKIWPAWFLRPVHRLNRFIPGGSPHEVGTNAQHDRDVHNLLEKMPAHLSFTADEEQRGTRGLKQIGIPEGAKFICLITRDNAYLEGYNPRGDYSYHDYRNVSIESCIPALESLAARGYYVVRMGAAVHQRLNSTHPRVIDYAANGQRTEFMDIYLGAKCFFCISVGTGFDAVPIIFRRPVVYINMVPVGYLFTFLKDALFLCKRHWLQAEGRWLSLREIFSLDAGFCLASSCFRARGIELVENTPEEISAVVLEIEERLSGTWVAEALDEDLQRRFWKLFPAHARDAKRERPLHGVIRGRYGAAFLREHREWLA